RPPDSLPSLDLFTAVNTIRLRTFSITRASGHTGDELGKDHLRKVAFGAVDVHCGEIRLLVVTQTIKPGLLRGHEEIAIRSEPIFCEARAAWRIDRGWRWFFSLRNGERLAQPVPRALFTRARVSHHLMNERQIQRRERQIVPAWS